MPACPAPATTPPVAQPPGRLERAAWSELPDWGRDTVRGSLEAFTKSCIVLEKQDAWKAMCAGAQTLAGASERDAASFFELNFDAYRVVNADGSDIGLITGYYEPLLRGSRTRSARYRFPLYGVPADLLTIDLAAVYPDLKNRRLRGRLEGNRVVPYFARGDIDRDDAPIRGSELVWVDDAVDAFFLHIQGSGQVQFENGERIRVGYADQNGHPFKSLGRALIERGELTFERASMQGIKDWVRRNPHAPRRC